MAKTAKQFAHCLVLVKQQWCKGCGICTAICDQKVLIIDNRGKAVTANPLACTGCRKCETHCPDFAISIEES